MNNIYTSTEPETARMGTMDKEEVEEEEKGVPQQAISNRAFWKILGYLCSQTRNGGKGLPLCRRHLIPITSAHRAM